MKAALLAAIKQPFVVEDIEFLDPAPGRVLVRTGASPFCSTDCVNWRGDLFKIPPTILGHASMGEVLEIGPGVTQIAVGDRVIVPGTSECGVCFYCSIGRPDQCSETCDRGGIWPHVANRHSGEPVSAAGNVGGYAEVMNVTASQVFGVQTDLPDEWLSLLGCGITTGVGCVLNIARVQAGSSIAIFGLGHLGQWMVQAARIAGARRIIAVDPISWRRELAGRFGATHVVDPDAEDPVAAVKALTGGRGADVTMEAATLASVYAPTIRAARRAGTVVLTSVETRPLGGDRPATGAVGRGTHDRGRAERAGADAQRPAAVHPDDGGRAARSGADHHDPLPARADRRCAARLGRAARPERRDRPEPAGLSRGEYALPSPG